MSESAITDVARARETIERTDRDQLSDDNSLRLADALDRLDAIMLNVTPEELTADCND